MVAHNEQRRVPHSQLSYDQSSTNKAGPIKPVVDELANQVQQKSKASADQVYMLRDKKFLTNVIEKADKQIIIKIGSADVPIKEIEGSIVIDNLDQSEAEKISKGAIDQEAWNNTSTPKSSQPTWCPSGLSRTQKCKLQCARCIKLKQEGLAKEQESAANIEKVGQVDLKSARMTSPLVVKVGQAGISGWPGRDGG